MRTGRWTSLALAGAILSVALTGASQASEPAREGEAAPQVAPSEPQAQPAQPQLPPGMFVWPRQPQAAPAMPVDPRGCTYRENKLDLIV